MIVDGSSDAGLAVMGWEVATSVELARLSSRLDDNAVKVRQGTRALADQRYVTARSVRLAERQGVVTCCPLSLNRMAKFVQHRLWAERQTVADLFRDDGIVFVCGDG
ncbi:hypothetical protein [Bradyrhizobium tropiciagri]|uniref:hypothetical protein n=1 Tax=Bradyrhizobium tropiciagri TaxID=312253 RepID=UPI00067BF3CF|nr:hypothetical protein [Bradyrhizobium tropiciagri]